MNKMKYFQKTACITLVLFALLFSACDNLNTTTIPEFFDKNLGTAVGKDAILRDISNPDRVSINGKSFLILEPGKEAIIDVSLDNPHNFDLEPILEYKTSLDSNEWLRENPWQNTKVTALFDTESRGKVVVSIANPAAGTRYILRLKLQNKEVGRIYDPYELPLLKGREPDDVIIPSDVETIDNGPNGPDPDIVGDYKLDGESVPKDDECFSHLEGDAEIKVIFDNPLDNYIGTKLQYYSDTSNKWIYYDNFNPPSAEYGDETDISILSDNVESKLSLGALKAGQEYRFRLEVTDSTNNKVYYIYLPVITAAELDILDHFELDGARVEEGKMKFNDLQNGTKLDIYFQNLSGHTIESRMEYALDPSIWNDYNSASPGEKEDYGKITIANENNSDHCTLSFIDLNAGQTYRLRLVVTDSTDNRVYYINLPVITAAPEPQDQLLKILGVVPMGPDQYKVYWTLDSSAGSMKEAVIMMGGKEKKFTESGIPFSLSLIYGTGESTNPYNVVISDSAISAIAPLTLTVVNEHGQSFIDDEAPSDYFYHSEEDKNLLEVYVGNLLSDDSGRGIHRGSPTALFNVFEHILGRYSHVKIIPSGPGSINVSQTYPINPSKYIVIEPWSDVTLSKNTRGQMFTIGNTGKLTIKGGYGNTLTLKGDPDNGIPLISVGSGGTLVMDDLAVITGNGSAVKSSTVGGGVHVDGGTFTMEGGEISDNGAANGGGVYVSNSGNFTMSGTAAISGNIADSDGGGVFVSSSLDYTSTFTLNGGTISGNTADYGGTDKSVHGGGGVHLGKGKITFNMSNGAISGNHADGSYGGGVHIAGNNDVTFNMTGGLIDGNTAENGGGIYFWEILFGRFTMKNGARIENNTASQNGGGICFMDMSFFKGCTFAIEKANIKSNTASGKGGGIYVGSGSDLEMSYIRGDTRIEENKASEGGGVFVNNDRLLSIEGSTAITGNSVTGAGGGIFWHGDPSTFTCAPSVTVSGNTKTPENTEDNFNPTYYP